MKKLFVFCSILIATAAFSQNDAMKMSGPPEGKALAGDFYGAPVSTKAEKYAITTTKLDEKLKKSTHLQNIAVKGKVTKVCEEKGCWLTLETENNEKFFVKMKDYAFFVPTSILGKTVVLEGNAETKIISVEELQHYAKDAKKPQSEIDAINQPREETRFLASGIKVVK